MRDFLIQLCRRVTHAADVDRNSRRRSWMLEPLEGRQLLAADFRLVKDINQVISPGDSAPDNTVEVNSLLYFAAYDGANGTELWKTDGTVAGTVMVKDINSQSSSSYPELLTNVNGTLFFTANDGASGVELWKSDGTSAGTVLVKNIRSGISSSSPASFTNVNGTLFFIADDGIAGKELWKSDGTTAGTRMVKDIQGGTYQYINYSTGFSETRPNSSFVSSLTNLNGTLFFAADDGITGDELWKSDGTAAGTVMVKDIHSGNYDFYDYWGAGPYDRPNNSRPFSLTNINGTLFFTANDGSSGRGLWKSDGTADGTVIVKDNGSGSFSLSSSSLTNVNGLLFFTASDGSNGSELWKSDGTADGTVIVKDIRSGSSGSYPSSLTNVNGSLFFAASDSSSGRELWKSNGTAAGTVIVKDNQSGSSSFNPKWLTNVNGSLFFTASGGGSGVELWKSNGTAAGTVIVKDIRSGSSGSYPSSLTAVNGLLFFAANDGTNGIELWKTNGTTAGTRILEIRSDPTRSSNPENQVNVNGTLYFTANDGIRGVELWKSNGTAAGTVIVKDILAGKSGSYPSWLTNVNGTLYFAAGFNGSELWKSDGTAAGTVMVKGRSGLFSYPSSLTNVNGTLFFAARDRANGEELWKSNGTARGTVIVRNIRSGNSGSSPSSLANVNGTLYFAANDGTTGEELWKSNGTEAGTVLVKNIRNGRDESYPSSLTNVNGTLYFAANDGKNGKELWKSNGTAAGTVLVKNIQLDSRNFWRSSAPTSLTNVNGILYFTADDGINGKELWKSNGTVSGTVIVKDIFSGTYEQRNYEGRGPGIWPNEAAPSSLTNVNGILYFSASSHANGEELWKSDGTAAGTVMAMNFLPGSRSGSPSGITVVNNLVFATATSLTTGTELHVLDLTKGTSGNDAFILRYSGTSADAKVTVRRATDGGPARILGTFPATFPLPIDGLGGTDSVRVVGTTGHDVFEGKVGSILVNGASIRLSRIESRTIAGGAGNDSYRFDADTPLGTFILDEAGGGVDTLDLSPTIGNVAVSLGTATLQTVNANLKLLLGSSQTFENAIGGRGNDTLRGNGLANALTGNGGSDSLVGFAGSDVMRGGPGNDIYYFSDATVAEADRVIELAGQGTDTLSFAPLTTAVTINLAATTVQAVHAKRSLRLNSGSTFENVIGGSANDLLIGNTLANVLKGNNGHDVLVGKERSDQLLGGAGRDLLLGGQGEDVLSGGTDDDILIAGITTSDTSVGDLNRLRNGWIANRNYTARVAALRSGVGSPAVSLKAKVTVRNDAGHDDLLTGGTGNDWYFRALDDAISDLASGELIGIL